MGKGFQHEERFMKRRQFMANLGLATMAMGASGVASGKPNILFIFADDQTHASIHALGNGEIRTPNLDRLVRRGMTFSNTYNPGSFSGAVCVASRTMLNTGMGMWQAREYFESFRKKKGQAPRSKVDNKLWSVCMANAGYETYGAGKWHIKPSMKAAFKHLGTERPGMPNQTDEGYNRPAPGNDWIPWDKKFEGYWKGGTHWSEVLADESVGFIEQAAKSDKPFFMYLAFNAPHDPRQAPKKYVDMYPPEQMKVPENMLPEYPEDDEIGIGHDSRDARITAFPRTPDAVRLHRSEYYALITHLDEQVGKIIDALDASGQAENTYIFFTADHGLAVGEHGLMGKQNMYDHSMRPPFIVAGPGVAAGAKTDTPIYLQDIMPTTLELGGAKAQRPVAFKSIVPLMLGKTAAHYDAIYGGFASKSKDATKTYEQRMVLEGDYKLILYPLVGSIKLFNTKKDPLEMHNLAQNPENKPKVKALLSTLRRLQQEQGDPLDIADHYPEWM
jgi:choline-sulfatase